MLNFTKIDKEVAERWLKEWKDFLYPTKIQEFCSTKPENWVYLYELLPVGDAKDYVQKYIKDNYTKSLDNAILLFMIAEDEMLASFASSQILKFVQAMNKKDKASAIEQISNSTSQWKGKSAI